MIEVSVYENAHAFAQNKRVFCRRIVETSISVPWDSITLAFRALFGHDSVVQFTLML